jgi:hypothetical protein
MAQEFTINSTAIESKINQLLPSQGGFGAGVDFSASTMVIPIVDLTETAEGSDVRADLQTSLSFNTTTAFSVSNTTTTVINTTGYFRIFGQISLAAAASESKVSFILRDSTTDKIIYTLSTNNITVGDFSGNSFDFNIFLRAGDSFKILASNATSQCIGSTRQIADIDGNLVNP